MARKRMISPEIWESQSFGKLSVLSKLIFIGLFSLADDEGKGILSPQLIKSKVLPFDEKTRATDVQQSISEICANMSIVAYEVEGKRYYKLTKWDEWQYIKKPTPSKLPDPPMSGEGEELISGAKVGNEYGNSTVPLPNEYPLEKEKEIEAAKLINKNKNKTCACAYDASNEDIMNSLANARNIALWTKGNATVVDEVLDALAANGYTYDLETISQTLFFTLIERVMKEKPTDTNAYVGAIIKGEKEKEAK